MAAIMMVALTDFDRRGARIARGTVFAVETGDEGEHLEAARLAAFATNSPPPPRQGRRAWGTFATRSEHVE